MDDHIAAIMDPIDEFMARPGGDPRPVIRALARDIRRYKVVTSGDVRIIQRRDGVEVVVPDRTPSLRGAFWVNLPSTFEITVDTGRLAGRLPWIGSVRIDGQRENGKAGAVPRLAISGPPNADRLSYVALRVLADDQGQWDPVETPSDLQVVHVADLLLPVEERRAGGLLPLAELAWDAAGRTPQRVRQMVYFDQRMVPIPWGDATVLEFFPV